MGHGKTRDNITDSNGSISCFHMVDHDILLDMLKAKYGVTDSALQWFNSYLRP